MNVSPSATSSAHFQDVGRGALARTALILAAVEVFGSTSPESATTRDIAHRAGQNISSIAYYFGNKEGLYVAVVEYINDIISKKVGPLLDEIEDFLVQPRQSPSRCLGYFGRLISASLATNRDMLAVTGLIVREQMQPTAGFAILYDGSLSRLQKVGAHLIDAYTGSPAGSEETAVRFHALLGQSLAFRLARETIIRSADWTDIGKTEEDLIQKVVIEQACDVLRSLRKRRARAHG
ncbi:MAG: bacterial regulatory s, tetR family protein [Polaromonas sp.]|nr:bacterial regulatory s, tetR family protein [Polaromonas sp.]